MHVCSYVHIGSSTVFQYVNHYPTDIIYYNIIIIVYYAHVYYMYLVCMNVEGNPNMYVLSV